MLQTLIIFLRFPREGRFTEEINPSQQNLDFILLSSLLSRLLILMAVTILTRNMRPRTQWITTVPH